MNLLSWCSSFCTSAQPAMRHMEGLSSGWLLQGDATLRSPSIQPVCRRNVTTLNILQNAINLDHCLPHLHPHLRKSPGTILLWVIRKNSIIQTPGSFLNEVRLHSWPTDSTTQYRAGVHGLWGLPLVSNLALHRVVVTFTKLLNCNLVFMFTK